ANASGGTGGVTFFLGGPACSGCTACAGGVFSGDPKFGFNVPDLSGATGLSGTTSTGPALSAESGVPGYACAYKPALAPTRGIQIQASEISSHGTRRADIQGSCAIFGLAQKASVDSF